MICPGRALKQRLQIADKAITVKQLYNVEIGIMDTHDPRYGVVIDKEMTKEDLINWIKKESGEWGMGSNGVSSVTIDRYTQHGSSYGWFAKEDDQKLLDYVKSLA